MKSSHKRILWIIGIGLVFFYVVGSSIPEVPTGPSEETKLTPEQIETKRRVEQAHAAAELRRKARSNPLPNVTLKKMTWSLEGFGTVMHVNFTVENKNDFGVKDIGFSCQTFGGSDTRLA
jgi:hypothetical protein